MRFSITAILSLAAVASAGFIDNENVRSAPRDLLLPETSSIEERSLVARAAPKTFTNNNGRDVVTGGCCNDGVNLRQDICNFNGETGRCIPAASTRNGCVGLTCVENSKLTCDPNTLDRGRDKCTLIPGQ